MQITIRSSLELKLKDNNILDDLMRVYSSAKRYAYKRLLEEKQTKNELKKEIQYKFNINARYSNAAIEDAKAIITSQKKLLPMYVKDLKTKIQNSNQKLKKAIKKKLEPIKLNGINNRINKLQTQLQDYEEHIKNKTIPKIVFGGRQAFIDLQKGKISNKDWKELRTNQLYSIGGRDDGGNQNLRLTHLKDNLFDLRISIGSREWIHGAVKVPNIYVKSLLNALQTGIAYTIRIIRKNNNYYCHISYAEVNNAISNNKGVAGIDLNPECVAVTIVKPDGNFVASKNFPCYAVVHARTNKRDWIIGNTIKEVYGWVESYDINTIAVEDLNFSQDHDTNKKFNRITHNFAKTKMENIIKTRALKEDFAVLEVHPAYSSIIGKLKYKDTYGLSDHQSAAFVIGRRALGFTDKMPAALQNIGSQSLKLRSCRWKDGFWASICRWKTLWTAVKRNLARFFKTNYKSKLGSGGYTALQYVLKDRFNLEIRLNFMTVNAGVPSGSLGTRPSFIVARPSLHGVDKKPM